MKLLIVDDDSILTQALSLSLSGFNFSKIEIANTATSGMEAFKALDPDVCLIDIDLKMGPTGVDLAHAMRKISSEVGIIFLTSMVDPRLVDSSIPDLPLNSVYLIKSSIGDLPELARILHGVGSGEEVQNLNILEASHSLDLTQSQFEVMRLVASGYSNPEIAKLRFTTIKSTENSISRLAKKLGISNSTSASQRVLIARKYAEFIGKL